MLDPFMGSGTTALAALLHGCMAVGIELNPVYAEMTRRRVVVHQIRERKTIPYSCRRTGQRSLCDAQPDLFCNRRVLKPSFS